MSCSCNSSPCSCSCCDPNNEPLASALNNFITAFFGTLTKSCVNNQVQWVLPCDLESGTTDFPRIAGEGLACYFLRFMQAQIADDVAPSVRVCFEPDMSIPNNVETVVTWNTQSWDNDNMQDPAFPSRLTAKTTGKYMIMAQIAWDPSAGGRKEIFIRQNGTTIRGHVRERIDDGTDTSENSYMQIHAFVEMTVNEYIELSVFQNTGAPVDILEHNPNSWMGMNLISTDTDFTDPD